MALIGFDSTFSQLDPTLARHQPNIDLIVPHRTKLIQVDPTNGSTLDQFESMLNQRRVNVRSVLDQYRANLSQCLVNSDQVGSDPADDG